MFAGVNDDSRAYVTLENRITTVRNDRTRDCRIAGLAGMHVYSAEEKRAP